MKNHLVQVVDRARQGFKRVPGRRDSISTSQLHAVPPEIWLHIFSYLSAPWDFKALSLTCLSFRQFAQPLLFTKICTHPLPPPLALRGLQTNKYRRRTEQRLEFFLSPHIAPAVRECWIDPPSAEDEDVPTDVVVDAIFDGLRKFPNLNVLVCRSIRLTPTRIAVLHHLALSTLTLESCPSDLTDIARSPAIPISYVIFKYHDTDAVLPPLVSVFLSPRHLQRLSATSTQIIPIISRSRPFTRLIFLEIPVECLVSDRILAALAGCPALERITLQSHAQVPRRGVPASLPDDLLPNLKFYRGPRNFAALFAAPPRRVHTVELSAPAKPHRLLRTLRLLPPALDALSFRVDGDVPPTLLAAVHARFPALRTLSVNDPALAPPALLELLRDVAPASLRVLRLRVEGRDRYNLWIPPVEEAADAVECYAKVRAALERVYPALVTLKFMYGVEGGSIVWRRSGASRQLVQVTQV